MSVISSCVLWSMLALHWSIDQNRLKKSAARLGCLVKGCTCSLSEHTEVITVHAECVSPACKHATQHVHCHRQCHLDTRKSSVEAALN